MIWVEDCSLEQKEGVQTKSLVADLDVQLVRFLSTWLIG